MRQASLKLKKYTDSINTINNNAEKFMLKVVLFSFAALAVWYLLLLGNIVLNIAERKTVEAKVRTLSSEVGDLELGYLAMSNNIDLNLSYSLGFKEVDAKFATRKTLDAVGFNSATSSDLSLNKARNDI